jgi:MSHA biogenesis protein MshP
MRPKLEHGFGTIAAIVILVILAVLGVFITRLSTSQNIGSGLDVNGSQAYAAAMSGSEWGIFQALINGACAATTTLPQTINGMAVTVTCQSVAAGNTVEAGLRTIFLITSTACNQAACPGNVSAPNYIERRVVALPEG